MANVIITIAWDVCTQLSKLSHTILSDDVSITVVRYIKAVTFLITQLKHMLYSRN